MPNQLKPLVNERPHQTVKELLHIKLFVAKLHLRTIKNNWKFVRNAPEHFSFFWFIKDCAKRAWLIITAR